MFLEPSFQLPTEALRNISSLTAAGSRARPILRTGVSPRVPEWGVLLSAERLADGAVELSVGTMVRNPGPAAVFGTLQTVIETCSAGRLTELRAAFHLGAFAENSYAQTFQDLRMLDDDVAEIVTRLRLGGAVVQEVRTPFLLAGALQTAELAFTMKAPKTQ